MTTNTAILPEPVDAAVGIPISWYFDPEILEIERRELFDFAPTYSGHVSLVPENGCYYSLTGQQAGKLLVRNHDRYHLVSNICRHRQALMLGGAGCAKNIVCPIHNWAYDLNGRQVAAPHFGHNPQLDLARDELVEWNGLLFGGPSDIRQELAPLAGWTELATSGYVLERVDEEEHELNWKVLLEVYLENYHIGAVHPGFRALIDPVDMRTSPQSVGGAHFYCEQVNVRWPMAIPGSPLFAEFQKILIDILDGFRPPFAAIWLCHFAGQLIEWYPFATIVTTYKPLTPTRTRLWSEYYFNAEIASTRRDYVEAGLAVLDEVTREDQVATEMLHAGRVALYERGENEAGPYQAPMEEGLRRFHHALRKICR